MNLLNWHEIQKIADHKRYHGAEYWRTMSWLDWAKIELREVFPMLDEAYFIKTIPIKRINIRRNSLRLTMLKHTTIQTISGEI